MTEPGNLAAVRRPVSLCQADDEQLARLRNHLETKGDIRLSLSAVIRLAIVCLCEREGVS